MYQIRCDDYILYDPRDGSLIVHNPKCKLKVNTVGEASFSIYSNHPYYGQLKKLKSVFEIQQNGEVIFRGRLTEDTKDFDNVKLVDLEGVMSYFNDSIIRPFNFPEDFENVNDAEYDEAIATGNVIEFFLSWIINQHNSQVEDFQKFKLGNVTVTDPNNFLSRASEDYTKTWEIIKSKLFESTLGGYFCIRYEDDGNYIDYLEDFEYTNIQRVNFGENLLDISTKSSATSTYSAILPLGKKNNEIDKASDDNSRLTIESIADGEITDDIVKEGDTLYSKKAVDDFGWIFAPPSDTTWDDITLAENLKTKGVEYLQATATKFANTITIKALDLHYADEEVAAFRINRYIGVNSKPHNHEGIYKLTELDIDILNPQNTKITLGDSSLSLTDINAKDRKTLVETVKNIKIQTSEQSIDISEIQNIVTEQATSVVSTCEEIILSAMNSYVETSNYSEFVETVTAQLKVMAEQISLNFSELTDSIVNVNGDLQEKYNLITKYFTFNIDGLTIGQSDNPYKVVIDNNRYSMFVNDVEVLWLDAEGKAHIPEMAVTRKINMLGYLIDRDENGNVNCEYVGGE